MNLLPLVWAGLWRRPWRTSFTAASIAVAFLLVGLLQGVNAGFEQTIAAARRDLLTTDARVRGSPPMPISMRDDIARVPGVAQIAPRAYFVGIFRPPYDIPAIATEPAAFFSLRPTLTVEPGHIDAIQATRTGLLATPALLRMYELEIGDKITLRSRERRLDGSSDWPFDIVGTFDSVNDPNTAVLAVINYAYFDESRAANRGTVERFYLRIADPRKSVATAAAIDALFANSSHETRTRSDQERAEADTKQLGDIAFFTNAILGAVLFALLFLTANAMRQSIHERLGEFAVLKALGFRDSTVFGLALAEALVLYVAGAVAGLALAAALAPLADEVTGAIRVSREVVLRAIGLAALLAAASVALPSLRLYRLSVAGALANH
jgi:putative ABC transport system permease protein